MSGVYGDVYGVACDTVISIVVPSTVATESNVVNKITAVRGDTLRRSFLNLGNISSRTKLWFTLKTDPDDTDSDSIVQMTEDDGLFVLNRSIAINPAIASIIVDDEVVGNVSIYIDETIMAGMNIGQSFFDIQWNSSTDTLTPTSGRLVIVRDVTRAIA